MIEANLKLPAITGKLKAECAKESLQFACKNRYVDYYIGHDETYGIV